jgi:hypothetical protein
MKLTLFKGYPDYVGKRQIFTGTGAGPSSYTQKTGSGTAASPNGGGDVIVYPPFQNYIDNVFPAMSLSGTYLVYAYPVQLGQRQVWALKWVTASTGAEVSASTDLSAENVVLSGFGGVY